VGARLEVQLDSIETDTPRRDRNVREVLFGLRPGATGVAVVEIVRLPPEDRSLRVGKKTKGTAELKVTLRGFTATWTAAVVVTRLERLTWRVETGKPVALSMEAMGLGQHAIALKRLCQHEALGDLVAIDAKLVFAATGP